MPALSPSTTRALLESLGHRPRRRLGQSFLVDANIVRKSMEMAGIKPGDVVVEVGPGLGTLTSELLEAGAEVWAVEADPRLGNHLEATLAVRHPKTLHLMLGDAMDHPLAGLDPRRATTFPFKIVSNLPYTIATPWLDAVLCGPLPERMVLMVQREAAQRYTAVPGSKSFGAISVFLQSAYDPGRGHPVSATCFHPRPEVQSTLLQLRRKPHPFVFSPGARTVVRTCFQQRRKQIGALARDRFPTLEATWLEHLRRAGLSGRARPEDIPVSVWQEFPAPPATGA